MRALMQVIVAALMLVAPMYPAAASVPPSSCDGANTWTDCYFNNTGSSVEIGADATRPGGGGNNNNNGGNAPDADRGPQSDAAPAPNEECNPVVGCRGNYQVWTIPEVTLADIASFTPARPSFTGEPDGIAVVGMPANFVAAATEQHIAGELFDHAVVVHFTPASYVFRYGDGSSRTSATGGAPWPSLGQAQFTATPTSHAYAARGTYSASVTVRYSASVEFDTGARRDVPGFVEATTGGYGVRVVEVHTALVDRTCLEDPTGPGC